MPDTTTSTHDPLSLEPTSQRRVPTLSPDGPVATLPSVPRRHHRLATAPDVLRALRRHWVLMLLVTVVVVGTTALLTARLAPTYEATTTLRIDERARTLPALDAMRGLEQNSDIPAEITELSSRALAEDVVDSLGLRVAVAPAGRGARTLPRDSVLRDVRAARGEDSATYRLSRRDDGSFLVAGARGDSLAVARPGGAATRVGALSFALAPGAAAVSRFVVRVTPFTDAVDAMRRRLRVTRPARESNVITVTYTGEDPLLVRDVPNAVAERFIERRVGARQAETRSTARFLRDQLDKLSVQLAAAENELRDFRQRANVVDMQEQGRSAVSNLAQLEAQRNLLDAEHVSLAQLLADANAAARTQQREAQGGIPARSPYRALVAFPTIIRNQTAAELLAALMSAEDKRAELLTRRTPQDPDVLNLTGRVHDIEEQLRSLSTTYLAGLGNEVGALDATLSSSRHQLASFPATQVRLARLERQASSLAEISNLLQTRLKEAQIAESAGDASVRVSDAAALPRRPVSPNPPLNLALATLTGLALGTALAFAREAVDTGVRTRNELQAVTGTPVLGFIPRMQAPSLPTAASAPGSSARPTLADGLALRGFIGRRTPSEPVAADAPGAAPGWPLSAAFERLVTNIAFARADSSVRTLLVTSPLPGDGKTTVAVNTAITLARTGRRVLLVDADVRRPMIHTLLGMPRVPGLNEVLREECDAVAACRPFSVGGTGSLHALPAGAAPEDAAALLASRASRRTLARLFADYDLVVVDSSPLNVVADGALLAGYADAVVLIARAGVTTPEDLAFALEQLHQVGASLLGTVLNDIDLERDASYDGAYRYYGRHTAYSTSGAV